MVKVAVAGVTGGIGRHIVETLISTNKHTVVALSRSSSNTTLEALGVQVAAVDYNDHASLVSALEGVHTVISTIFAMDDTLLTSQLALLRAAVDAGVKRFVPSEFGLHRPDDTKGLYQYKASVLAAVAKSGLEWTIVENGIFMNYFASGTKGQGHLPPHKFVVDVENATATVPGTGEAKIAFTRAEDVAALVVASLDLDKWPERMGVACDVKTYNEVIALAEKVRGRKFEVKYVPEDDFQKSLDPNPSSPAVNFFAEIMITLARGEGTTYDANSSALLPEVKPVGLEAFLKTWWS